MAGGCLAFLSHFVYTKEKRQPAPYGATKGAIRVNEIEQWMQLYMQAMRAAFDGRIVCMGLQGSRARGEGTPGSDIDVVLILDQLGFADLVRYRAAMGSLPQRELACGFVGGKQELLCWERGDLFHFYYDTQVYAGSLDFLRPLLRRADLRRCVLAGACNLYHACAHNFLHERDQGLLRGLQKAAFFTLRAQYLYEYGRFVQRKSELLPLLGAQARSLLEADPQADWVALSQRLLLWASGLIQRYGSDEEAGT